MLPSILAKQLQRGIGDYIDTTFPMTNDPFRGSVREMLQTRGSVYHEPYMAVRLPFRVAESMPTCFEAISPSFLPYVHQQKAFERLTGDDGRSTLIATGTGSGKTECFLYPILEYCYRHRGERGIKALIIYPMNALAADQAKRIASLIYENDKLRGNVTVGMYVGGFDREASRMMTERGVITDRETMLGNAPDILMTNYKMLDYLLVRPKDARLWQDNRPETLKYIAVDELHTFDGAQGTDLACLLRRLKRRLRIFKGDLCCIGTSATMGGESDNKQIVEYANGVFGEEFGNDAVITEDRLSALEFFDGVDVTEFAMPTAEQAAELERLSAEDEPMDYLRFAVKAWLPEFTYDVEQDEGRIELGKVLMHHSFMQSVIHLTGGMYYQASAIVDRLITHYPVLKQMHDATVVVDSLFALISHARTGKPGALRPFLNVQVQLWIRELRRLVAKVDRDHVSYEIAHDLNKSQAREYLPVVNCRDCGMTGWASVINERNNATMTSLESFYNLYFRADEKITMMFPGLQGERIKGMIPARLCPDCLQVKIGEEGSDECVSCGNRMIDIAIPSPIKTHGPKSHKQYICPCCGSRRGISMMGVRCATEISASISQMFASKFNDDKKTLAFSDSVQDAAHRAGFFNSKTWRFGLRTAIQRYCDEEGAGRSLAAFETGFIDYWHKQMAESEAFVSFFIAPNLTWKHAYEEMIEKRKLGKGKQAQILMYEIEQRLKYEIMLEYGIAGKVGRTLEKSSCSVISFDRRDIAQIAEAVHVRTVNELGVLTSRRLALFERIVVGVLNAMRTNGAFRDEVFDEYTKSDGKSYMLTNDRNRWLPGLQGGRNTPRFVAEHRGGGSVPGDFDALGASLYIDWIKNCVCDDEYVLLDEDRYRAICKIVVEEAVNNGVVLIVPSTISYIIYGLNKERVYITNEVVKMRCNRCGTLYSVSRDNAELWRETHCQRSTCKGRVEVYETGEVDYYGRLYRMGDLARINAKEHTGLLERSDRESLEIDFKRSKGDQANWDPNVLSCTPTLEMGIDIGDLSSVILCSMPPAQSKFLQRSGRAGRKDGNAFVLAVANARPHDLYFYADPIDMIAGNVVPPQIFLEASAVLERQFVAYCMDSWVKSGKADGAIPDQVGIVLRKLDERCDDMFPFNFLSFVKSTLTNQLNTFKQMFENESSEAVYEDLQMFARGSQSSESPMYIKILDAFEGLKKQKDALRGSVDALRVMIGELEAKPKDRSFDEEIKQLKNEEMALLSVMQEIDKKNIYNFLSDEGLLPNYAFPEAGIILRAVLYRREDEDRDKGANANANATKKPKKYENIVYEYNRSASSAISEFAPHNSFYAGGRKLTIDQVDLTTAQTARWRLCPNCSHAQIEDTTKNTSACPQCGSPAWADSGQVRSMLKVQMVYSTMDYTKSLINDESEDRNHVFYCQQLLVDVDEDHDISSAYRMDNEDFPFGYEFVRKATLREINFGESDMAGEKLSVSGVEEVRKGFRICKYCGKIQPEGERRHSFSCKTRKLTSLMQTEAYEECLFLYREFSTEILRLLVPATTMDSTTVKMESFVAAFMLGMKVYFGNVEHLRATVSEVPVADAEYRKQYLVIYDSIPGGTGYLKQLMHDENALVEIFEHALNVMENCTCKDDPQKDGCYHCLYAYRQSRQIGHISRATAIRLLKSILSGKDRVEMIKKINDIPVNPLFDSELEQRFMEAVRTKVGAAKVSDTIRNGKHGYYIEFDDIAWEIEPQVCLDMELGVSVSSKPDFIFWPVSAPGHKPVAVFTDGFLYHKDIVSDDTIKREAIRRSGNFRVWSLSFKDVQNAFAPQGDFYTATLAPEKMPFGKVMYQSMIKKKGVDVIEPAKLSSFDLLVEYLRRPDAEKIFKGHAHAYSLSILDPVSMKDEHARMSFKAAVEPVVEQTHFANVDDTLRETVFGIWTPRCSSAHLSIYASISQVDLKNDGDVAVCAILKDEPELRTDKYEQEWNGFWRFHNLMQFSDAFIGVSSVGITRMDYNALPIGIHNASDPAVVEVGIDGAWDEIKSMLFGDDAKAFVEIAKEAGFPAPSEDGIGYEVEGDNGEVVAMVEIAWPDRRIGFMTQEQVEYREKLEQLGWKIMTILDAVDIDAAQLFGGKSL